MGTASPTPSTDLPAPEPAPTPMPLSMREERRPPERATAEVAPGVLRIQLPMNMPGLGHVNCYVIEDRKGVALIDPGTPSLRSWQVLRRRLDEAGLPLRRVHTVVVTHSHPDHYGAAQRVRALTGAELITHENFKTYWDPHEEDDFIREVAVPGRPYRGRLAQDHPPPTQLPVGPAPAVGRGSARQRLAGALAVADRAVAAGQGVAATQALHPGYRRPSAFAGRP